MIEKHIILEDVDPVTFYGVGNSHLQVIKSLYPKLRIAARDNVIRVLGDEEEMAAFEEQIENIRRHVVKFNAIGDEDILDIVKGKRTKADSVKGVIVYNVSGKPIKCRSKNQQKLADAFEKDDMIFAIGPAGTGKTYLSIALAVKALKEKAIRKIILSRPAVEAGEKLGFLPGDMKEKIDPNMHVIDIVVKAMQECGVPPKVEPIRGGTDGAQLSFKGLPCPNIFAGGVNFHGPYEFVSVQVMEKAMQVVTKICELTAEFND